MTPEEIAKLQRAYYEDGYKHAQKEERERCAKIAESAIADDSPLLAKDQGSNIPNAFNTALLIAKAIRE